jgi:hypothetical protein
MQLARFRNIGRVMAMLGALTLVFAVTGEEVQADVAEPTIITLTQTGCQFVEVEERDHMFQPASAADCKQINATTAKERLSTAKVLELKPGPYIFRVTNQNVPYELGFYLRGAGLGRLTLPKVSGGGLLTGVSQDYAINLREGEYVYSCPLNPTPDYRLLVRQ